MGPKMSPLGYRPHGIWVSFVCLFLLRPPWGAPLEYRVCKSHSRISKMSPKNCRKSSKTYLKIVKQYAKQTESGDKCFAKKQKNAGIPPCISGFCGARILCRVWIPALSKKATLKNGKRAALYSMFFGARNLGRVLEATGFVGSSVG